MTPLQRSGAVPLALVALVAATVTGCSAGSTEPAADPGVTVSGAPSPGGAQQGNRPLHRHGAGGHVVIGEGLSASLRGYTLDALDLRPAGSQLSFRILGPSGEPHDDFAVTHTKRLHLFVVSEDLSDFRHVHPSRDASGTWTVALPDITPGRNHVVAEFAPIDGGKQVSMMLGGDVDAPGRPPASKLPAPADTVTVDGYTVMLTGVLIPGANSLLNVSVTDRSGQPAALKLYLASWSHGALVHADSLAVTHLHPLEPVIPGAAPPKDLNFNVTTLQPGAYRFVVEFATASGLHQAELTMKAR